MTRRHDPEPPDEAGPKLPPTRQGARVLVEACIGALAEEIPVDARVLETPLREPGEGRLLRLELKLDGHEVELDALPMPSLRPEQVGPLVHRIRQLEARGLRPLVCAGRIGDPLGRDLRAQGVAYVDRGGNAWLRAPGIWILIAGLRPAEPETKRLGLRGTEIRLLGVFLRDPDAGERIQTELAELGGISLGAVGAAREQLTHLGLLERRGDRRWRLRDRTAGLARFGEGWATRVRKQLNPKAYRLLEAKDSGSLEERIAKADPELGCLLGGERAAAHLTGFLETDHATLHVLPMRRKELVRALGLAPDPHGPLTLLDRYGLGERRDLPDLPRVPLAHPLWVWAECLTQTDERVVQTAARLHEWLLTSEDA